MTQGCPRSPREAQGGPARTQTPKSGGPGSPSKGAPRDAQGIPERPREAQGGPGRLREAQGTPRGHPGEAQGGAGKPKGPREAQQKKHRQGRGHRWPFCRNRTADNHREPLQTLIIVRVWDIYQIHHRFGVGKTLVNFVNVNMT